MLGLGYKINENSVCISVIDENYKIIDEFTIYFFDLFEGAKKLEEYIKNNIVSHVDVNYIKDDVDELAKRLTIYFKKFIGIKYKYNELTNTYTQFEFKS